MALDYILKSERLVLRPFKLSDPEIVKNLAGNKDIAATTLEIPHPYPEGLAEEWISKHEQMRKNGSQLVFAITFENILIGAIGCVINKNFNNCEIGYWIGRPYWGNGFATEALGQVIKFGFEKLSFNKIHAHFMENNPASGKVMIKNGMKHEGTLKQHIIKDGKYLDIILYGILKSEFTERNRIN